MQAIKNLESLKLPPHPDTVKSWDTWKIIDFVVKQKKKDSKILDVGCNGSPILPYLRRLGYHNLYGCDVDLKIRKRHFLKRIRNKLLMTNPDELLNELLENKDNFFNLSKEDLEKTNYDSNMFDIITSLSVIEHGVNISNYFGEISRLLKNGGFLLTSTDYWPKKIESRSNVYKRPDGDKIFDKMEIEKAIAMANDHGLELIESINFEYKDRVVNWKKTGNEYTFVFFCMQKK